MSNEPTQPITPESIQGQFFYFEGQELVLNNQTGKPRISYNVFLGENKIGFLQIDNNSPDKMPAYGHFVPIIDGKEQPLMKFLCPKPKQSTNQNWWLSCDTAKEIYTAFCLDFEQQYSDTIIGQFEQIAVFAPPIEVIINPTKTTEEEKARFAAEWKSKNKDCPITGIMPVSGKFPNFYLPERQNPPPSGVVKID